MPGMNFEYDESGTTFYYFLLAFYALVLLPLTFYFWPSSKSDNAEQSKKKCHCDGCQVKRLILKSQSPWKERKRKLLKLVFFILWIVFAVLLYKVNTIKMEWKEFDPYGVLNIDRGAKESEVRRAYRQLSLLHHPDKGGDPLVFQEIAKAYRALTNERDRENWEQHGNPDGPGATSFGIALPKWLIKRENSLLVLGAYGFVFMILLPVSVGTWWYRTIKFTGESILMETMRDFAWHLCHSPNMKYNRIVLTLATAREFNKPDNPEVIERPSDNYEVPALLKHLPEVSKCSEGNKKKRKLPMLPPYAIKASALLHAHLKRLELNRNTLELDRRLIVKKCPALLQSLVTLGLQLMQMMHDKPRHQPKFETIENIMKLSPIIVQGMWDNKSPLLQLPHITEDSLRHFDTRKRSIRTVRQLVQMPDSERRSLLRGLTDDQYRDVMTVCHAMPHVDMQYKVEVIDDNKPDQVTANSVVTLTVTLKRQSLGELVSATEAAAATANSAAAAAATTAAAASAAAASDDAVAAANGETVGYGEGNGEGNCVGDSPARTLAAADADAAAAAAGSTGAVIQQQQQRQSKKKKGGKDNWLGKGSKNKAKGKQQQQQAKQLKLKQQQQQQQAANGQAAQESAAGDEQQQQQQQIVKKRDDEEEDDAADDEQQLQQQEEDEEEEEQRQRQQQDDDEDAGDDNEQWDKLQEELRRENSLETKERTRWIVHCPQFPSEKLEYWWLYACDRKKNEFITPPQLIHSLNSIEDVPLKLCAPPVPGVYNYCLCLRSDSYLNLEINQPFKLDVQPAAAVPIVPDDHLYDSSDARSESDGSSDGFDDDYSD